jgi:hypothetical protein
LKHAKALRKCGRDAAAIAVLEPVVPEMARELGDKDESTMVASLELALARSEAGLVQDLREARSAVARMLANEEPLTDQRPSTGCGIKWKV